MTAAGDQRVAVVGGGLAGITTALRCADAGCEVTLYESRPRLGGLTHSFRRDGIWVDNGQHVFMRCCTSYLALLDRLGVSDLVHLQHRLDVPVRSGRRRGTVRLSRTRLPAPFHLAVALARYRWLSPAERVGVLRAALALTKLDRNDVNVDTRSFGDWLAQHGQQEHARQALWDVVGVATLNARADHVSLALAATVFQVGLLKSASAADLGWARVPLQHLHGDAAISALTAAGATVRTSSRVCSVERARDGWRVGVGDDDDIVDAVVLAVPPAAAESLLPAGAVVQAPGWAAALGGSPIVNVHVVFARQVLDEEFVAAVDSPLQWVFDRTSHSNLAEGQYLAISLSAADDFVGLPTAELRYLLLPELLRLLPDAVDVPVKEFFVTRERQATFRPEPGSARLRPGTATTMPGLHLAGAWTATGWPATMEGAVRSGEAAADAVLHSVDGYRATASFGVGA